MRVTLKNIVINGNMSSDVISSTIQLDQDFSYSVQAMWSGAPTGSIQLEASDDYEINESGVVVNPGTWIPIFNSSQAIGAEDGKVMWNAWGTTGYAWGRLHYQGTGTGTLNAKVFIRGF